MTEEKKTAPLKDVARFSPGDIVMLLRVAFYAAADGWTLPDAIRMVAVVAMMALARIGSRQMSKIKLADYRPNGEDVFIVESRGKVRTIPVMPALGVAVDRYLKVRPVSSSDLLFTTKAGTPLRIGFFATSFKQLADHLGADHPLKGMLRRFCTEGLHTEDKEDEIVVEHFLHGAPKGTEQVSVARMRKLLTRCDQFDGRLPRAIGNDEFAVSLAREYGTDVPRELRTRPSQLGTPLIPHLGPEHPFVARLSTVEWAEKRPARAAQAVRLMQEDKDQLRFLIDKQLLSKVQAKSLYHLSQSGFNIAFARLDMTKDEKDRLREEGIEKRGRDKPKRRRPRSTAEDRAFLEVVGSLDLSKANHNRVHAVDQGIRRHFPKAVELLNRRILSNVEAADLFGISDTQVATLRMVFRSEVGLKHESAIARQARHAAAHEIIRREGGANGNETRLQRHRRLTDCGFQYGMSAMLAFEKFGE